MYLPTYLGAAISRRNVRKAAVPIKEFQDEDVVQGDLDAKARLEEGGGGLTPLRRGYRCGVRLLARNLKL